MIYFPFDCILIDGLQFRCIIGIHPEERQVPQPLRLDLWMHHPVTQAAESEAIADTVDYQSVAELAMTHATEGRFALVETLVQTLAERILESQPVSWVCIRAVKPEAIAQAAGVGVMIERGTRPPARV
ncbi:MAG: dihydroneopterin aldolase [Halothiobacillaceae bacterium]